MKKIGLTPQLASFALTILLISLLTPIVYASKPPATLPKIQFLGYHKNPDLTVDFRYRVTAGSSKVTKWEITSPCFTKASFVGSNPKGELNPAKRSISFQTTINPGKSKDFRITLKVDYCSVVIGPIPYTIYYPPNKKCGTINGPEKLVPPPVTPPKIQFLGYHQNPDLTVDFCYRVTAGSSKVTKWEITSPCFTKDSFVGSTPKGELNPAKHSIHFQTTINPGKSKDFCITLKIDYYSLVIGPIPYTIYYPPNKKCGTINGPTTPSITVEIPLGTTGTVIPLIAALGLIIATKKSIITLS